MAKLVFLLFCLLPLSPLVWCNDNRVEGGAALTASSSTSAVSHSSSSGDDGLDWIKGSSSSSSSGSRSDTRSNDVSSTSYDFSSSSSSSSPSEPCYDCPGLGQILIEGIGAVFGLIGGLLGAPQQRRSRIRVSVSCPRGFCSTSSGCCRIFRGYCPRSCNSESVGAQPRRLVARPRAPSVQVSQRRSSTGDQPRFLPSTRRLGGTGGFDFSRAVTNDVQSRISRG